MICSSRVHKNVYCVARGVYFIGGPPLVLSILGLRLPRAPQAEEGRRGPPRNTPPPSSLAPLPSPAFFRPASSPGQCGSSERAAGRGAHMRSVKLLHNMRSVELLPLLAVKRFDFGTSCSASCLRLRKEAPRVNTAEYPRSE